jgi:hypothetical protein
MDRELRKHLTAYADGELPAELRAKIEALLAADPAAQAEVRWWQDLRRGVRRVLEAEAVPAGLSAAVGARLRPRPRFTRSWTFRLGVPGAAAAAILLVVFFLVPRAETTPLTPLTPSSLIRIHDSCAVQGRHDTLGVRAEHASASPRCVKGRAKFACGVPDVSGCGKFRIDGACECSPRPDVRVVHTYFRSDVEPNVIVSAFSVDRPIRFCGSDGSQCRCKPSKVRRYEEGVRENVALLCWQERDRSYVLLARIPAQQLASLADGLQLAALDRLFATQGRALAIATPSEP